MSSGNTHATSSNHDPAHVQDKTYEATRARQWSESMADKVHWEESLSFRGQPYRHLHHQRGVIGTFTVRLLEAKDLKRSHWSALALGPVKHFGLSKAHGAVSSFCTVGLEFVEEDELDHNDKEFRATIARNNNNNNDTSSNNRGQKKDNTANNPLVLPGSDDRKQPAERWSSSSWVQAKKSPVVPHNDNPVWDNFSLDYSLHKNSMPIDGMRIVVKLRVDEESTAVESILPVGGGAGGGDDSRMLGVGQLDVTDLCLGQTKQGLALPGIQDAWLPLHLPRRGEEQNDPDDQPQDDRKLPPQTDLNNDTTTPSNGEELTASSSTTTGRVRIFVSYEPYGMEPQKNDIVALECFARRHWPSASCRPILYPPLQPMRVLDCRAPYLLLSTSSSSSSSITGGDTRIRLHRNAVFVVERFNLVDAAQNLALLPADLLLSTPVGQASVEMAGPVVAAGREVLMPAILSLKLFWMALRTTALASISSVQALGSTMWEEGSNSLMEQNNRKGSARRSNNNSSNDNSSDNSNVKLIKL